MTYHGVLAPAAEWRDWIVPAEPHTSPREPAQTLAANALRPTHAKTRATWAELLKRVFEIDVLTCPWCGEKRKLIALITDGHVKGTGNYDIRSDTCNQVYDSDDDGLAIAAADYTAGVVLTKNNVIFRSEYASETTGGECPEGQTGDSSQRWPCMGDYLCAGAKFFGHGRGMCQNGSQRWATGKNAAGVVVTSPRDWGIPPRAIPMYVSWIGD